MFFDKLKQTLGVASTGESIQNTTDNAIDNRDSAVRHIVKSLKRATSSRSDVLTRMTIVIVVANEDYDPVAYSWADDRLLLDLRLALDNAMLESVGSKYMNIQFVPIDKLPADKYPVVDNKLYIVWERNLDNNAKKKVDRTFHKAEIKILSGTDGSLMQPSYIMESNSDRVYTIGRGEQSRTSSGVIRRNDIVVSDNDASEISDRANKRVSSCHADIVVRKGNFYLRAAAGGCRASGGSPTRLLRGESIMELNDVHTLYPLVDDDIINLGKTINLHFKIISDGTVS